MCLAPILLLPCLNACFFTGAGDSGEADVTPAPPTKLDLLLVIDTSGSMKEESSAVLLGASDVIGALGDTDWQIAVTTTSASFGSGLTPDLDPGEAGTLSGPVIVPGDDAATGLREVLACTTIYWKDSDLLSDPQYAAAADGSCPLPSAAAAMCERGGDVPGDCFSTDSSISEDQAAVNADFWRDDALPRAVVISDEGDGSRRVTSSDADVTAYIDLYGQLSADFRLYVLGPAYPDGDGSCLDSAQTWGVERYKNAATQ